jgi:hypothetical protein
MWQTSGTREPRLRDLLAEFNDHGVQFIVVGAHALAAHGCVRATKDLDIWMRPELENARRAIAALRKFGAPLHDLTENDLSSPGTTFQIGLPPLRIDILTAITGVEFEEAWLGRIKSMFADQPVSVLSKGHLLQNKRAIGRKQDLADVEWLEAETNGRIAGTLFTCVSRALRRVSAVMRIGISSIVERIARRFVPARFRVWNVGIRNIPSRYVERAVFLRGCTIIQVGGQL